MKSQTNTNKHSAATKTDLTADRRDASWERTHLACSVNRETVSTLEACAPRKSPDKILSRRPSICRLVAQSSRAATKTTVHCALWSAAACSGPYAHLVNACIGEDGPRMFEENSMA